MFHYTFQKDSSIPLYQQLYQAIKEDILNQALTAHSKLPSKKAMQQLTQLSQSTIETAYEMLVMEGYIYPLNRKGYYVCDIPQIHQPSPSFIFNEEPKEIHYRYDFRSSHVDTSHFPYATFIKLQRECMLQSQGLLEIGEGKGDFHLRKTICEYIARERNVICSPSSIIVGAGMEYLLQLLAILLPDGCFGLEYPGYKKGKLILNNLNKEYQLLPLDEMGVTIPDQSIQYLLLTPSHQFPSGICMPIARRKALVAWAMEKEGRYIIEDDYDSEFQYVGKPIPSMHSLSSEHVIYMNTFSRSLSPSLRQSYIVLPPALLKLYDEKMSFYSSTVSRFEQETLARFIEGGYYARHIGRMRRYYKEQRDILLQLLQELFPNSQISGEQGGLHLCLHLATSKNEMEIIEKAKEKGIGLTPYEANNKNWEITLMIGFANLSDNVKEGLTILKQIITEEK